MNGWIDGWLGGWVDGWMNAAAHTLAPHMSPSAKGSGGGIYKRRAKSNVREGDWRRGGQENSASKQTWPRWSITRCEGGGGRREGRSMRVA